MNQKPWSHLGFCSLPWLKRKSFFCPQNEMNKVYNPAFRAWKLQRCSLPGCCSQPRFPSSLPLLPILSLRYPSLHRCPCRHPSVLSPPALNIPSPADLHTGRRFLHRWELDCCLYWFGSLFSKHRRWPHGVVFVASLLLPFIITGRWSPCVFSNVV